MVSGAGGLAQILAFTQQSKTADSKGDGGRVLMVAGGPMPPLPNSDEMAEMFGIEIIHGLAPTFTELR